MALGAIQLVRKSSSWKILLEADWVGCDSVLQRRRHRSGKNVLIPMRNFETSMVPPSRSSVT